jgi:1-acyl-sn-glycerol-3-phosphate acyltransferase
MRKNILRDLIFILFFRPLVWVFLGLDVKHRDRLPLKGPAILVANHNSHMDTVVLMSLYPLKYLYQVRPVASADYFLSNRYLEWFSRRILQIIPIHRIIPKIKFKNPLEKVEEALQQGSILIYYPEGTRGEPEKMGEFKKGIGRLAKQYPEVPILPIYLHGLGKVLPKGQVLWVPFNVKVVVGKAITREVDGQDFIVHLRDKIASLAKEV